MFGVHCAGAQALPINPTYTERESDYIPGDAEPAGIVYDAEIADKVEPLIRGHRIRHAVCVGGGTGRSLDGWKHETSRQMPQPWPASDDLATLQYTGGTTGRPKGVNIDSLGKCPSMSASVRPPCRRSRVTKALYV